MHVGMSIDRQIRHLHVYITHVDADCEAHFVTLPDEIALIGIIKLL